MGTRLQASRAKTERICPKVKHGLAKQDLAVRPAEHWCFDKLKISRRLTKVQVTHPQKRMGDPAA